MPYLSIRKKIIFDHAPFRNKVLFSHCLETCLDNKCSSVLEKQCMALIITNETDKHLDTVFRPLNQINIVKKIQHFSNYSVHVFGKLILISKPSYIVHSWN